MKTFEVHPVGIVRQTDNGAFIELEKRYAPALKSLDGFGHVNVLWWFSDSDNDTSRAMLQVARPYVGAPETMGTFATRSPMRPNPIALTACEVIDIDHERGIIHVSFIDADDLTPVLDIKPYTPSFDRVESPSVPYWCGHWPASTEQSGSFDWGEVFAWEQY